MLDGDIRTTARFVSWTQQTKDISELEDKVPQTVVPRNSVSVLLAAQRVITIKIHGLLAKRTRGRVHRLTEETGDGSAEDFGWKDGGTGRQPGWHGDNLVGLDVGPPAYQQQR